NTDSNAASATWAYDTSAPTATVDFPVSGTFYNSAGWAASLSGTADDHGGSGVAEVDVAIKDTTSGMWYGGSSFDQASQTFLAASGTTSWSYALAAAKLTDGDHYSVTVKTSDSATNANTDSNAASATWAYDTSAPTATVDFPVSGTFYNSAGWAGSLSGTADDHGGSGVAEVDVA